MLLSVLPTIVLLSDFASTRIDDDIARNMSLNRRGSRDIEKLFTSAHNHFDVGILIAFLMATAGTITVAITIQQVYEKSFDHQHTKGVRNIVRCVMWLVVVGGLLVTDANITRHTEGIPAGVVLAGFVDFVLLTLFFWWSMSFLLRGREPWKRLLPAAVATACFWIGFGVFSSFYFSGSIISDYKLYGAVGMVFDILTWFIAVGAVIILGAVVGVVWEARRRPTT